MRFPLIAQAMSFGMRLPSDMLFGRYRSFIRRLLYDRYRPIATTKGCWPQDRRE
jgi:hypothetical protein